MEKPTNLAAVREAKKNARRIASGGAPPVGEDTTKTAELPPDCPVVPLGKDGRVRYYLDVERQLVALPDRDHSRLGILGLFGRRAEFLRQHWPRLDKTGAVTGWRPEEAAERLIAACSAQGVWDARERQRGRGAWLGDNGDLVLHTGSHVMTFPATPTPYLDHRSERAGLVGRYVYSAKAPAGTPSIDPAPEARDGPAQLLLDMLRMWSWQRGEMDAVLLLGWIGAAMIGGALACRAMGSETRTKGTGKSTLQDLLKHVFGGALIQTSDTSAAGLYQTVAHQTLPIAIDEIEAEADNRRAYAVIKLARVAASGGLMLRGGSDHQATEFTVRSAFLFSSILIPSMPPQDRSRITILELGELPAGGKAPVIDAKMLGTLGAGLRRRLVDGWHRWTATLDAYQDALKEAGHTARSADQLGTLLTAGDVLLRDELRAGRVNDWAGQLRAADLSDAADEERDEDRCLAMLLSKPADTFRSGIQRTVAEWVRIAVGVIEGDDAEAGRTLARVGLRVLLPEPAKGDQPAKAMRLAVANYHSGLATLFNGTPWQGSPNGSGVWVQSLKRLQGAGPVRHPMYFAGATSRAIEIPIVVVVPLDDVDPQHHERLLRKG